MGGVRERSVCGGWTLGASLPTSLPLVDRTGEARGAGSGLVCRDLCGGKRPAWEGWGSSVQRVINEELLGSQPSAALQCSLLSQPARRAWEPFVMQILLAACLTPWDFFSVIYG